VSTLRSSVAAVFRRLSVLSPQSSALVGWACFFYLGHLVFQARTAGSEIGAFFAIFVTAWAIWRGELRPSFHIVGFPLALYALATTISIFVPGRDIDIGPVVIVNKALLFFAAIILFREVPELRRAALVAHAVFAVWIASAGLWEFFALHQRDLEHRITGNSTHVMTFSGLLLPLSLLFGILWMRERKWWMFVPAVLSSFVLLLTYTRSAWLAWIFAVFAVVILPRPRWLAYATAILVLFISLMPIGMFGRLMSSFDPHVESNLDRIRMLEAGQEMIRDYPLFGVGPANVKEVYPIYRRPDAPRFKVPHLHNNVVQIWAERGILALAGYILFIYLFVRECARAWRTPARKWAEAGIAVAAALTYAGLFEFNFGDTEVFYLMLDIFALVLVSIEAERRMNASVSLFPAP
jgi:O-antigen ligase